MSRKAILNTQTPYSQMVQETHTSGVGMYNALTGSSTVSGLSKFFNVSFLCQTMGELIYFYGVNGQ